MSVEEALAPVYALGARRNPFIANIIIGSTMLAATFGLAWIVWAV